METGAILRNDGSTIQKSQHELSLSGVKTYITAPFASIEDLSPEDEANPNRATSRMSSQNSTETSRMNSQNSTETKDGSTKMACLEMPLTPRIDISRASSSSQHDDSSPEREILGGETGKMPSNKCKANEK